MTTYGIVDDEKKQIVTVEATTLREAQLLFKRAGYAGEGWLYPVVPVTSIPANVHFAKAAEIAAEGRKHIK